jgi:hypothetical protein
VEILATISYCIHWPATAFRTLTGVSFVLHGEAMKRNAPMLSQPSMVSANRIPL